MCKFLTNLFGKNKPKPKPPIEKPDITDPVIDPIDESTNNGNVTDPIIDETTGGEDPVIIPAPDPKDVIAPDHIYARRASDLNEVELVAGINYVLKENDFNEDKYPLYENIAEWHGMHQDTLRAYNPAPDYKIGDTLYIPSSDELCFFEYYRAYKTLENTVAEFNLLPYLPNKKLLLTARYRGAGEIGQAYATQATVFKSPNGNLAGAFERNSEMINNQKEYNVNWGPNLWKCNIFANDCVYSSGYETAFMENAHYTTAGTIHQHANYEQLKIEDITPGCVLQLFGGTGSNSSHNMILVSFVEREKLDNGSERWKFKAMGAEYDKAAVSQREHVVKLGETGNYYEVDQSLDFSGREYIRFLQPIFQREDAPSMA